MGRPGLLILAVVMLAALAGGILLLAHLNARRQLRERMRGLVLTGAMAEVARLPSIQLRGSTSTTGVTRALRLLNYRPEIPQAQVVPWPLVLLAAAAVGVLAHMQATALLGSVLAVPAALAAAALAARGIFGWQHARYCQAVFEQIPEAIGLMVRAIRAGLPLAEALRSISREMAAPTKDEFARVVGDMAIGRPVDAALMRLHERTGLTEYAFLAVTLGLQAQTGGSLAETLDNLADMVRKRVALSKRASALAGEAKVQAGMLLVMPFLAAAGLSVIQPFYVAAFTETDAGRTMLMIGFGLMVLGVLSIRWLIRQAGRD